MSTTIHLPVANLSVSTAFYDGLGLHRPVHRGTPTTATWELSQEVYLVAHTMEDFSTALRHGDVPDRPSGMRQMLLTLTMGSQAEVDGFVARALSLGGRLYRPALEEVRGRYTGAVQDPDGHVWQASWTDPAQEARLPLP